MSRLVWRVPVAINAILRMRLYLRVSISLGLDIIDPKPIELKLNTPLAGHDEARNELPTSIVATNTSL